MKSTLFQALVVAPVLDMLSATSVFFVMVKTINPSTPGHRAGVSAVAFWTVFPGIVAIVSFGFAYALYRTIVPRRGSTTLSMLRFFLTGLITASLIPYFIDISLGNLTLPLNFAIAFCFGSCLAAELWLVGFRTNSDLSLNSKEH